MIANEIRSDGNGAKTQAMRRARARKSCSGEATIELLAGDGEVCELPAKLVDMSDYGVGFETTSPVKVGSRIAISSRFFNSGATASYRREARVVHSALRAGNVYRSGACFEREKASGPGADLEDTIARAGAGPLPDYYEVLQISAHADTEMIQRVFRLLAQRYHPDNIESGNEEVFRSVLQAYRVLSDPESRAAYDAKYKTARAERLKIFEQQEPADYALEKDVRARILRELYEARKKHPDKPGVSLRELEEALACSRERLEFNLWYLRGKAQAAPTDTGSYVTTPEGVDAAERGRRENFRPVTPLLEGPRAVSC